MNTGTTGTTYGAMRSNRWAWATGLGVAAVLGYMYYNRAHALSPETRATIRRDLEDAKLAGERVVDKGKESISAIGRKVRRRHGHAGREVGIH